MNFGQVFDLLLRGTIQGFRLPEWSEDVVIRMQLPDDNSKMTHPYLYIESYFGKVPWKETMVELFSDDWESVFE